MAIPTSFKTIGFFGDSFCGNTSEQSWTTILAKKLNLDVVNVGMNGSSIWSAILKYNALADKKQLPDISIFCWTNPYRLYHPNKPVLLSSADNEDQKKVSNLDDAVKKYFAYLWFNEKELLNYKYTLEYFDKEVLVKNNKIFFQVFSINPIDNQTNITVDLQNNFIREFSLLNFSGYRQEDHYNKKLQNGLINHMSSNKNKELADYFIHRINNIDKS